ncbi:hypothetical protein E4T56_gene19775 [Termitomyces sp. T112]|nr:hypothetical protein E4T56_gene19775 [Termitomyces sp. T112]
MDFNYNHDDFTIIRQDTRYGGFEQVKHKDNLMEDMCFFRKSLNSSNEEEFEDMMKLQQCVMKEGCSGAVYPIYEARGKKWVVMSVPADTLKNTGLGA